MAGGAVHYSPLTGPVGYTLAVGTTHPIPFLSEMALTAHLIGVIHFYFCPLLGIQKITFILVMTCKTLQGFIFRAMYQNDIAMGHLRGLVNWGFVVVMAVAASKTLDLVMTRFCPEKPALVSCVDQNRVFWNAGD